MAWEFNAFTGTQTGSDATRLIFLAGPDMPAGYEIRIVGAGLGFDEGTGALTGTITSFQLYDPAFLSNSGVRQTISVALADQATLAASITSFLQSGLGMIADTFTAWDLLGDGVDHLGGADIAPDGTAITIELLEAGGTVLGYLRIEGTGLLDATVSQTGLISKIIHLDALGNLVAGEVANYTGAEREFSAFEYALQSRGLPDPGGGIQGNDEVLYPVMVAGDNTITKFDLVDSGYNGFEGGTGADTFTHDPGSDGGGQVDYTFATGGVIASLADGTSSGPDGVDTWDPARFGGLGGSNFDDTLTGHSAGSAIFARAGDDLVTGLGGHDYLDGGDGLDDLNGGDGDDFIFGGTGDDDIHGGLNAGDNFGDAGDGTDDVIVYLHIGLPPAPGAPAQFGGAADDYLAGITVNLLGGGDGTVTGDGAADGIGTDTFEDIEQVWGTMNDDAFGVDVLIGSDDIAMFTGMGGADTFTGGASHDIVNYDNEVFSDTIFSSALAGTFNTGVTVNMSAVLQFGQAAGTATDSFGDIDTLADIDDVFGTAFADILIGDDAINQLEGKEGADYLDGGLGNDRLFGGLGNDTFVINSVGDLLFEQGGVDTVRSTFTKTLAAGFENLTLLGTGAINATGNSAANVLIGNAGTNKLTGGAGRDTMTGGGARDIFDFDTATESGKTAATRDKIADFRHLTDDIDLSTIDANGTAAGNIAFTFLAAANAAFTGVKGQLHWFQINAAGTASDKTIVEGDINGDKRADFQIELTGLKVLTAGDFIL